MRNRSNAPIIRYERSDDRFSVAGRSLVVHEWTGSGPDYLHVHYSDDEAWHVLEGTLTFRFEDRNVDAPSGTSVFVPAGAAHTYFVSQAPCRYLMILTPRLDALIKELHATPYAEHASV